MDPAVVVAITSVVLEKGLPYAIDAIVALQKPAADITIEDIRNLGELPEPETFFEGD